MWRIEKKKDYTNENMGGGPFDEEMGEYEMKILSSWLWRKSSLGGGPFLKMKMKILSNWLWGKSGALQGKKWNEMKMGKYEMKTLSSLGGGPFLKMKMKILSF